MADKEQLGKMLDSIIKDKDHEQAEIHFHTFAQEVMKSMIHGEDEPDTETTNKE